MFSHSYFPIQCVIFCLAVLYLSKRGRYSLKIIHMLIIPFRMLGVHFTFVISANIIFIPFSFIEAEAVSFEILSNSDRIFDPQELLDLKQRQRGGPELVQEIRKQANDVSVQICWGTFVSFLHSFNYMVHCPAH